MKALAVALLLATPVAAQQRQAPASSGKERASVALAAARGALIHAYDQAGWHGTDAMIAGLPDYQRRVGGWIVEGDAARPVLTFFDTNRTRAVYSARFERAKMVESKPTDAPLSADQLRLVAALASAKAAIAADRTTFRCADKPFNTVILPPEVPGGPIAVYFLSPQVSRDALPFGGHYRIEVDAEGRAGPVRAFSKSCIAIPTGAPASARGVRPEGTFVTHLVDPVPTEIHVFSSLSLGRPVFVATTAPVPRLWIVQGATIAGPRALPTPSPAR